MKALSIKEPWLTMIVEGKKTIETRTWYAPISLKDKQLLLAGSKIPKGNFSGKAACIIRVDDCHIMRDEDEESACCEVYSRAISWVLRDIQRVWPVPILGQLKIYDVDDELIKLMDDTDPIFPTEAEVDRAVGKIGQYELDFLGKDDKRKWKR